MLQNSHLRDRVRQRIDNAEKRAAKILAAHRSALEALARELMAERSLGADRIAAQLQGIGMGEKAAGDPRASEGQNTGESNQTAMTQTE